jgi:hypothetical protein
MVNTPIEFLQSSYHLSEQFRELDHYPDANYREIILQILEDRVVELLWQSGATGLETSNICTRLELADGDRAVCEVVRRLHNKHWIEQTARNTLRMKDYALQKMLVPTADQSVR